MDDPALRESKRALRVRMRAVRDAIPPSERQRASADAMKVLFGLLGAERPKRVSFFAAIGSEIEISALEPGFAAMGVETYYPRVEGDRIAFRRATRDDLVPGTWNIPEPPIRAPEAPTLDVMIVPGVAFDAACRRLGNGKGYYDRAIAELRPVRTIGVCFHAQLVEEVPTGPHDAVLDMVVTEQGILHRALH